MRPIVVAAVGLLCLVGVPARSGAMIIIENNASSLSVDSGPPVPVTDYYNRLEGTSAATSLYFDFRTGGDRPFFLAEAGITPSGGAVDASIVLDVEFTSDRGQYFAVRGHMTPGSTARFSISYGSDPPAFDRSYSNDFVVGAFLAPGVHYHLSAEIADLAGAFYIVVQTPEPSLALLALFAALTLLPRTKAKGY